MQMDGEIAVTSEKGGGSPFSFEVTMPSCAKPIAGQSQMRPVQAGELLTLGAEYNLIS